MSTSSAARARAEHRIVNATNGEYNKSSKTWRGDLMRRIADVNAKIDDLKRNAPQLGKYAERIELEHKLADLKQELSRQAT